MAIFHKVLFILLAMKKLRHCRIVQNWRETYTSYVLLVMGKQSKDVSTLTSLATDQKILTSLSSVQSAC